MRSGFFLNRIPVQYIKILQLCNEIYQDNDDNRVAISTN
jgi:hypothetical protein